MKQRLTLECLLLQLLPVLARFLFVVIIAAILLTLFVAVLLREVGLGLLEGLACVTHRRHTSLSLSDGLYAELDSSSS
jgi:hypothetical protein